MKRFSLKSLIFSSLFFFPFSTFAASKTSEEKAIVTYQVTASGQMQQDEILATLRIEHSDNKSDLLQTMINKDMRAALDLTSKYPNVLTSTGRYFVYHDEQNSLYKGSQTIQLDSFDKNSMDGLAGELQKIGFIIENYSYSLSEKNKQSLYDSLRLELLEKATRSAKEVIAKGLHKNFIGFTQIDFSTQNYTPILFARSASISGASNNGSSSDPTAQAGLANVQMTANITAKFGN